MSRNCNKNLTETETKAVGELIGGLKKLYGENLSKVILYGSKARGDSHKDSDVDVMVVLKKIEDLFVEREKVYELVWRLSYKYDLLVSVLLRDGNYYKEALTPLMWNIKKEGVGLWIR